MIPEKEKLKKLGSSIRIDTRYSYKWMKVVENIMKSHGWQELGRGKYAIVFGKPGKNFVIKFFMYDPAFLLWYDFCKKRKNPYCPKYGKIRQFGKNLYAVTMERLERLSYNECVEFVDDLENERNEHLKELKKFFMDNRHILDIHCENIMKRKDGSFVVVDPFYNWYRGGKFTIDIGDR